MINPIFIKLINNINKNLKLIEGICGILIIFGLIFSVLYHSAGLVFVTIAVLLMAIIYFLLSFKNEFIKKCSTIEKFMGKVGYRVLSIMTVSLLYSIQNWPMKGMFINVGIFSLLAFCIVLIGTRIIKKLEWNLDWQLLYRIIIIGLITICFFLMEIFNSVDIDIPDKL